MPLYEVLTTKGALDADMREKLAAHITKVHTEETGSPADFVQVIFPELPAGHSYTAGSVAAPHIIRAQIRAGRPLSVRHAIIHRLFDFYTELTGVDGARDRRHRRPGPMGDGGRHDHARADT